MMRYSLVSHAFYLVIKVTHIRPPLVLECTTYIFDGSLLCLSCYKSNFNQIEALKAIGVTEVVLAINYQPKVNLDLIVC